jgi:hypothetical protein
VMNTICQRSLATLRVKVSLLGLAPHRQSQFERTIDDVNLSLHVEERPDGSSRSVFSYRCFRHVKRAS